MIYHFTKVVGLDVDANSLKSAQSVADDVGTAIDNGLSDLNEHIVNGGVHSGDIEYAGYTTDSYADSFCDDEELTAEEELLNYFCSDDDISTRSSVYDDAFEEEYDDGEDTDDEADTVLDTSYNDEELSDEEKDIVDTTVVSLAEILSGLFGVTTSN